MCNNRKSPVIKISHLVFDRLEKRRINDSVKMNTKGYLFPSQYV